MKLIKSLSGLMFTASFFILVTQSVLAETDGVNSVNVRGKRKVISTIPQLSEVELPQTKAALLLTQNPSAEAIVEVTGVRITKTEKGVEIILETNKSDTLQPVQKNEANKLIINVPNSQLRYEGGNTFRQEKPFAGIAEVLVVNQDNNTIQVTVTGETQLPTVELFDGDEGLIFGVTPAATAMQPPQQPTSETPQEEPAAPADEPIELVVTGEEDKYRVTNTTTGTRTDTPLRDLPQSIQVIPQEVLRDQRADISSALINAPSVRTSSPTNFETLRIRVRGFFTQPTLNGFKDSLSSNLGPDLTGIERIEVLQGPNSILFGSSSPGGTVNFVTKQPLRDPYYFAEATIGNFNFYRGEVDLSGPLDDAKKVLYRLNASYRDQEFFIDSSKARNLVIAPVVSIELGENTNLTVEGIYKNIKSEGISFGLPAIGTILSNPNGKIPRDRNVNEGSINTEVSRIGYTLEHKFSEAWSFKNSFQYSRFYSPDLGTFPVGLLDDNRTLERIYIEGLYDQRDYRLLTNVIGKFATGSIKHQLLFGFDLGRQSIDSSGIDREIAPLDLFNPIYGQLPGAITFESDTNTVTDELGFIVQDQVTIADNLKLLLSGRFDNFKQTDKDFLADTETSQSGSAFSPRVGILYQPIPPISLYANYSQSFQPAIGRAFDESEFKPTKGTQFEIGVKADLNDRLSTTLALYDITQSNIVTDDPDNLGFSVQTGEQRSQGIELSVAGEILSGWNIFASYAYNDARVTKDNIIPVGNRALQTTPHAASLWTTYEIQRGDLQGLGFGLGLFYVGDRAGDAGNTFEVPSYLTTDAAIFYKQDRLRAAINIKNLFNVDYFENAFNRLRVSPGAPFTVQGTISWTF
ncbi:TonB-dependent siderophore receptor [Nostoc sp. KVJ20]|uniref:TonB-dependent siderophore receptor n=1 Tax=Nostoc sp. KVJ20 TaxID=457944 RepID=UPI000A02B5F5|nr:TonB-dependent siderophore receptor [Nostoc sp. KVJ20]